MAVLAGELIQSARDAHPSFDLRAHPDPVLVRALSTEQTVLAAWMVGTNPESLSVGLEPIELADYDFAEGVELPPNYLVHDPAEAVYTDTTFGSSEVHRISWGNRLGPRPVLAFALNGRNLYLAGVALEWTGVAQVLVQYAPTPEPLAGLASELVLPDMAHPYLRAYLEAFMARRSPKAADVDRAQFAMDQSQARRDLDQAVRRAYVAKVIRRGRTKSH